MVTCAVIHLKRREVKLLINRVNGVLWQKRFIVSLKMNSYVLDMHILCFLCRKLTNLNAVYQAL